MSIESFRSRRTFLKQAISVVPSVTLLASASELVMSKGAQAASNGRSATPYQPTFFTPAEWAFLNAATDRLIPPNADGPGAVEAGVPEFIDRQMESGYGHGEFWYMSGPFVTDVDMTLGYQLNYTPRDLYRAAIADIDKVCTDTHGHPFHELDGSTQDEVLTSLQKGTLALPHVVKSGEFFIQLLANTKEGYFADPMYGGNKHMGSWKMIGFTGARADFTDWMNKQGQVYPLGPVSVLGEKG
ncbi:gluconate 2-dehydrogenase subunit 3 family protein [Acetobacteraceae bacterium ESL0709]|nr:gluconate 2-dehydrogenase subunit 3 family protein [Acetobacteraceae bacterium ESL0697]MDF7677901.1 gluconate 2-dehydrogenase subunit 3 family protein [Acetobacteraceae bacterium ESL0709]